MENVDTISSKVLKIIEIGRDKRDVSALRDALELTRFIERINSASVFDENVETIFDDRSFSVAHKLSAKTRQTCGELIRLKQATQEIADVYHETLIFDAPYSFDCFCRAIEFNQPNSKRFYAPRREYLKPFIAAYQEVLDGKLDVLTISMPKRTGKSQMGILFTLLVSGRFPHRSTLMEGSGDDLINSFFRGELEYLDVNSAYSFYKIFPESVIVRTNADSHTINLKSDSRFPTIMCRSIDARQIGLSEATNLLYLDDCVDGRREGKNRDRLEEKWEILSGDVLGRALEGTPVVACGTRYSIYDPLGKLQNDAAKQGKRLKVLEVPALSLETDESNFTYYNYQTKKWTFTTEYFRQQRDLLTEQQFNSEFQQMPTEESGVLLSERELNRYYELPVNSLPDAILAVCDTADGKGDSLAMGIGFVYGQDVFIVDCVFSSATPDHTLPQCVNKLIEYKVQSAMFESNKAGEYFARDVESAVRKRGGICAFKTKYTTSNKATRIEYASPIIKSHFYFKDKSLYKASSQYGQMIRELCAYTRNGKVSHDDAPDMLSLMVGELQRTVFPNARIERRSYF